MSRNDFIIFQGDWVQISGEWFQVVDILAGDYVVLDSGDRVFAGADTVINDVVSDGEFRMAV